MPPAQSRQDSPVCDAERPAASTMPSCRCSGLSSSSISRCIASTAGSPSSSDQRPAPFHDTFASAWVASAPTPAIAAGTAEPTARNLDATATPHDSPSADRPTMEKVMPPPYAGVDRVLRGSPSCPIRPTATLFRGRRLRRGALLRGRGLVRAQSLRLLGDDVLRLGQVVGLFV